MLSCRAIPALIVEKAESLQDVWEKEEDDVEENK